MNYFIDTLIKGKSFEEVIEIVKSELGKEGFGVPSEVDMQGTFKKKLNINFRKYIILGACNPEYALKAVQAEKNIGVLLPCSIAVQEYGNGDVGVAAVNPLTSMMEVNNNAVQDVASEITKRLERVIENLS